MEESPLARALRMYHSLSITGMGKNAGKTTVLNHMLALLSGGTQTPALTSVGRDGESTDIVTGTAKPGIWVRAGTMIATAAGLLRHGDVTPEILATTGIHTPLGEVVVFRALSDGAVQLAGPSMNDQLAELTATLRGLGADIVLIDGAVSRKSLAAPVVSEATVLCAGASYGPDMESVIADTAYACRLLMLPESRGERPRRHLLEGAATNAVLQKLAPQPGDEVTVRDGSRVLLTRAAFERLAASGVHFSVLQPAVLCCVCINPFSATGANFDRDAFMAGMMAAVPVPVLNVAEVCG